MRKGDIGYTARFGTGDGEIPYGVCEEQNENHETVLEVHGNSQSSAVDIMAERGPRQHFT